MFTLFTLIIKHLRVNNNFATLFTLIIKHLRVNNNFLGAPWKVCPFYCLHCLQPHNQMIFKPLW